MGGSEIIASWNRVAYTLSEGQEKETNFGWNRSPFSADKIRGIEPLACYSDGGANPLSRAKVNESASALARPTFALLEATHSVAICERLDFTPLQILRDL